MSATKLQIENAASALIGRRLWTCRRAADMTIFQFGVRRQVLDFFGKASEVGEYALHIQCAWRITRNHQVVVGSGDLYFPAEYDDVNEELPAEFDWARDANRLDRRLLSLFGNGTPEFVVQGVRANGAGALHIALSMGLGLDVLPDDSLNREYWRLFRPGVEESHLVVAATGVES